MIINLKRKRFVGRNVWMCDVQLYPGGFTLDLNSINGDINDLRGLEAAIDKTIRETPRYLRVVSGGGTLLPR